MKVLLTAATLQETQILRDRLGMALGEGGLWKASIGNLLDVSLLVTGIGMVNTAYHVGRQFVVERPDAAWQLGIGGAFVGGPAIGQVVEIVEECYPELGADTPSATLGLEEMGFAHFTVQGRAFYNTLAQRRASLPGFAACRAVTVNRVSGEANAIAKLLQTWGPQVESMEGAAFFQACLLADIPFRQFRAISNLVEPRNRDNWRMKEAIEALNQSVLDLLSIASSDPSIL